MLKIMIKNYRREHSFTHTRRKKKGIKPTAIRSYQVFYEIIKDFYQRLHFVLSTTKIEIVQELNPQQANRPRP